MTRTEILEIAKPILFNTEMVRAILNNEKSVTRRPVKPKSPKACGFYVVRDNNRNFMDVYDYDEDEAMFESPQARLHIGDYLYVRETWCKGCIVGSKQYHYVSQGEISDIIFKEECLRNHIGIDNVVWKPSIHMPKEAARIFLRVINIFPQLVKEITEEQAIAEGFTSKAEFISEFLKIYPSCTEDSWVWVIEFERVEVE